MISWQVEEKLVWQSTLTHCIIPLYNIIMNKGHFNHDIMAGRREACMAKHTHSLDYSLIQYYYEQRTFQP